MATSLFSKIKTAGKDKRQPSIPTYQVNEKLIFDSDVTQNENGQSPTLKVSAVVPTTIPGSSGNG